MTTSIVAERQEPLRRQFTDDPEAALTVKHVRTVHAPDRGPLHAYVESVGEFGEVGFEVGQDHKVGGYEDLPNSGHVLCAALAACADSTIRMVADHVGVEFAHLHVEAEGVVDVRGCLAMRRDVRVGFGSITLTVHAEPAPGTDPRRLRRVLDTAEQLCVVLDTVRDGVPITVARQVSETAPRRRPTGRPV